MPPTLYYEPKITLLARPTFTAPEHLPVSWLGEGTDGERLAEFAGRLCYMSQANPAKRATGITSRTSSVRGMAASSSTPTTQFFSRSESVVDARAGSPSGRLRVLTALAAIRDESTASFVVPPAIVATKRSNRRGEAKSRLLRKLRRACGAIDGSLGWVATRCIDERWLARQRAESFRTPPRQRSS